MAEGTGESITTAGDSPVERAFRVLQAVVAAGDSIGIRELARRTGLPRSTVGRLTATLSDLGMVTRTGAGAVLPGRALATLQPSGLTALTTADRLRPVLVELVQRFGEHAAVSIDDGDALLYVAQVSSDHAVTVPDVSGQRHHFHLVAPGIVTMAWWAPNRVALLLAGELAALTPNSVVDVEAIEQRLDVVRGDGWAWTDQELDVGVNGLAVPVIVRKQLVATVSLFGPDYRFGPKLLPDLGLEVLRIVGERTADWER